MQYKHIFAVGDVHGMYDKLVMLMEKIPFHPSEDLLIFLGDYIDRGPSSLASLDYVMELTSKYPKNVIALLGNHEFMMLNYFKGQQNDPACIENLLYIWLENGGYTTAKEIQTLSDEELKKRIDWVRSLPLFYQIDNFYFCHAGIRPSVPLAKQKKKDLLWIRDSFFEQYNNQYGTIVIGHTVIQKRKYLFDDTVFDKSNSVVPQFTKNGIVFCDTGAYLDGGKLSCVDVLSKQFWQA